MLIACPAVALARPADDAEHTHIHTITAITLLAVAQSITILVLGWNIVRRRRSERARLASEATIGSLFRAAPAGLGMTVDRKLKRVNQHMCDMLEYHRDHLVGENARMLYPTQEDYDYVGTEKYRQIEAHGVGTVETRWLKRDGQVIDVLLSSCPVDSDDLSKGVTFAALDITLRKQAEHALKESEQRFRELVDHLEEVFWIADAETGKTLYASPSLERKWGIPLEKVKSGCMWHQVVHPDDVQHVREARKRLRQGEQMDIEFRIMQPDDTVRWVQDRGFPIVEDGKVTRTAGLVSDITDRKESEAAIGSLARFPAEDPNPVLRLEPTGEVLYTNDAARRLLAEHAVTENIVPKNWLKALREALATQKNQHMDVNSGAHTFTLVFAPIADAAHVNVYGMDVTERRQAEVRQRLIMRELDHRVKNNLAAVQSLAERSIRRADSLADFRESFMGRLQAMARTHEALAQTRWDGVDLHDAVHLVLGPYIQAGSKRLELQGDRLRLPARAALPIGLALHELATNAVKYGSLSCADGRVCLSWETMDDCNIELTWREVGGPPITHPTHSGTGTALIEGLIGYELQGAVELAYPTSGVTCKMTIPLSRFAERGSVSDTVTNQDSCNKDVTS